MIQMNVANKRLQRLEYQERKKYTVSLEPGRCKYRKMENNLDSFVTYLKFKLMLGTYLLKCLTEHFGIKEKIASSRNVLLRPSFYSIVAISLVCHNEDYVYLSLFYDDVDDGGSATTTKTY
jgi:hypothetical protein